MRSAAFLLLLLSASAGCAGAGPPLGSGDVSSGDEGGAVGDCPGHWHAAVTFFVHDMHVQFTPNPAYTLEGGTMPLRTHMHRGSESVWHFEPSQTACIPLAEALATVDVAMEAGRLELAGAYHAEREWGGVHEDDGDRVLRAWLRPHGGDWAPATAADLAAGQVADGAQVLVAYGDHDDAHVAHMQGEAAEVPAALRPGD